MKRAALFGFKNFSLSHRTSHYPLSNHSSSLSHHHLVTSNLLSVSTDLPIMNVSYKRNHLIGKLLCLASLTQLNLFKVHSHCSMYQYFASLRG